MPGSLPGSVLRTARKGRLAPARDTATRPRPVRLRNPGSGCVRFPLPALQPREPTALASRPRPPTAPPRRATRPGGPAAPRAPTAPRRLPNESTEPRAPHPASEPAPCAVASRSGHSAGAAAPVAASARPLRSPRTPRGPIPQSQQNNDSSESLLSGCPGTGRNKTKTVENVPGGRAPLAPSRACSALPLPPPPQGCMIYSFPLPLLGLLQAHL